MRLGRLLQAELPVIASRGWQELWRSLDRLVLSYDGHLPLPRIEHLKPASHVRGWEAREEDKAHAQAAFEAFRREAGGRFFAGADEPGITTWIGREADWARSQTLAAAEAVCERRFSLLGHPALFVGEHIDWHRDPVSGRRAPMLHWSRLDPLDAENVGDSKVVWELNRHQWLLELGQAYRYTGQERYAEQFALCVLDWMRANPPGMGINWASSLEAAYRLIAWCWALFLFRDSRVLTPRLYLELRAWIGLHAAHVEKYLSHYFSPNTHLTGEALGLFYAGVLFPDLPRAARWRKQGTRILLQQLRLQVLEDGTYFEQSTCYQRYTADIYLHFYILARRSRQPLSAEVGATLQRMLDCLLTLRLPDGRVPQIGDADGGRVLPLLRRSPEDMRDLFALGAALFHRRDYAWAAGGPQPETAWLLGQEGCEAFAAFEAKPPLLPPSRLLPDGGYAVMRSGWERNAHQLIFDVGPLGCPVSGAHGHADLLSIQVAAFGGTQLEDPGTYCYTAHANWRDYFRSTAAHSTVTVDRQPQAQPRGPFTWRQRPRVRLRRWLSTPAFDLADAEHEAYRVLRDPVLHRRRVFFLKPRWWLLVDDLEGRDIHELELRFQFASRRVVLDAHGWADSRDQDGRGLLIKPFVTTPLEARIHEGALEPIQGWTSPDYGLRRPAPALVYSGLLQLPVRIATLLIPSDSPAAPPAVSADYRCADGLLLRFAQGGASLMVNERGIYFRESVDPEADTLCAE